MPIEKEQLMSFWDFGNMPVCDEGVELARKLLQAASNCVSNLGVGRTSNTRADLLCTYNAMLVHSDRCNKCNEV